MNAVTSKIGEASYESCVAETIKKFGQNLKDDRRQTIESIISAGNNSVLDSEKCTIGGQNGDSGKFHVRIRAPRHR